MSRPDPHRVEHPSRDVPLLTHDETAATSVARACAVAVADRTITRSRSAAAEPQAPARGSSSGWRRLRRTLYVLAGLAVFGPVLAFVIGWMLFDVRSADDATITQVATFTFTDGEPLATVRPENVNRVKVTLDQVPEHVRQAVLAAEDRSFYSNPGFDIIGIGRAVHNQLTGGVGGGSTITQQYVKVVTGQDDFSLWRKYREVVLAVKISREQTKDQILESYLNTIYLGRGAYGIQAAAQAYFGKNVDDRENPLTVSEGAMLAGIIQSPARWDPAKNLDRSQERWSFVLDGMAEQGWITEGQRATQTFPTNWLPEAPPVEGVPDDERYHIYDKARAELEAQGITEDQLNTQGLTITTTIDPERQQAAVDAVTRTLDGEPANLRSALVSIDPRTGAILAYYGGPNGLGTNYAEALRQPGSSFKPFVLAAALQGSDGVGLGTIYDGSSPQEFEGTTINNSEGFSCAACTVQTAMTRSINTIFYRIALDVGIRNVIDAAHQAGIPADLLPEARGGIALGDQEVHPTDMASAFGTFAADGVHREPYLVAKVVAAGGQVLYDRGEPVPAPVAIPQQVARNVTEAMLDVAGSSGIALSDGRRVAVKTGTVQLPGSDGQNKDAWTVGYTPSISTAVWVGSDQSDPIKNSAGRPIYGRMLPGSIWQEYMSDALRGTPKEEFSRFEPIGEPPVAEPSTDPGAAGTSAPDGVPGFGAEPGTDPFGGGFGPDAGGFGRGDFGTDGLGERGSGDGDGGGGDSGSPFGERGAPFLPNTGNDDDGGPTGADDPGARNDPGGRDGRRVPDDGSG